MGTILYGVGAGRRILKREVRQGRHPGLWAVACAAVGVLLLVGTAHEVFRHHRRQ